MFLLSILEAIVLLIYVAYLVNSYAQQNLPIHIKAFTYISWLLSFGVVFIIPHDIYYQIKGDQNDSDSIRFWNIIYWGNFVLSWIILPLLQEYEDAGEFTFREKLVRSLKNNLLFYAIAGGVIAVFVVYQYAYKHQHWSSVISLLTTIANCFGMGLLILLLGYGLIAIPRDYRKKSQYEPCLQGLYKQATVIEEKKLGLHSQLEEQARVLISLKKQYDSHPYYFQYIENIIAQELPYELVEVANQLERMEPSQLAALFGPITLGKLAELNRKIKKLTSEYRRATTKWDKLCSECFLLEDILESRFSIDCKIRSTLRGQRSGRFGQFLDQLEWLWYIRMKPFYVLTTAMIFALLSLLVLLGELSVFSDNHDFNLLGNMVSSDENLRSDRGFIQIQLMVLIPLIYIAFCTFYGLFNLNFLGMYGFYDHQQTDAPSLMFGSINFSRVSFPLTFNFLQMMNITDISETPFAKVAGNMEVLPEFGMRFWLPILLFMMSLFNLFGFLPKLLEYIGGNPPIKASDLEQEGRKLLCRARVTRERELLNQNAESIFNRSLTRVRDSFKYYAFQNFDEILKI